MILATNEKETSGVFPCSLSLAQRLAKRRRALARLQSKERGRREQESERRFRKRVFFSLSFFRRRGKGVRERKKKKVLGKKGGRRADKSSREGTLFQVDFLFRFAYIDLLF